MPSLRAVLLTTTADNCPFSLFEGYIKLEHTVVFYFDAGNDLFTIAYSGDLRFIRPWAG